ARMTSSIRTVRLVVLSGGLEAARRAIAERYPTAEVEIVEKERLRGRGRFRLLAELRRRRTDRFVFYTYVNAWQLGRFLMALYGWLSGAARVELLDVEHVAEELGPA